MCIVLHRLESIELSTLPTVHGPTKLPLPGLLGNSFPGFDHLQNTMLLVEELVVVLASVVPMLLLLLFKRPTLR